MQNQSAHEHVAKTARKLVKEVALPPGDRSGQFGWPWGKIQTCHLRLGKPVRDSLAQAASSRANFNQTYLGPAGSDKLLCVLANGATQRASHPAGITHQGIDSQEIQTAANGGGVIGRKVIEDLPTNDSAYCHILASRIRYIVARMSSSKQPIIYLDNNATTRVDPAVFEAMLPWLREEYGNPSSVYSLGKHAADALDRARNQVASLINCTSEEIIFTSCGSESINSAILAAASIDPDKTHIVTTAVEHSATIKLCEHLARRGYEITWLPVNNLGGLDLEKLERAIRPDTALVTLLWANNETGVLFPIQEIACITNNRKVALHVDAVQAAGKVPLNVKDLGIQFLSLSGHKLYCPKGVGALYVNARVRFTPWLRGSQESGRRGGTQNVASIVGLGKAAELAASHLNADSSNGGRMRDQFEEAILKSVPGTEVNGDRKNRLPNTSNIAFEGIESEGALMLLDERGICCSAGSACTSGSVHPSHVLKAMGFSNHRARSSLRFTFGRFSTDEHVAIASAAVPEVVERLRRLSHAKGPVVMAA